MDCRPRVDRVLILSAFRLLHLRYLVNPIPAGRLKPLFFMSSFPCPFICLLLICLPVCLVLAIESEKVFLSPRCLKQLDGAKVCIKRLRGLPRIALYIPRTAFIINNSAPTRGHPIPTIPLPSATPVFMDSSPIDAGTFFYFPYYFR